MRVALLLLAVVGAIVLESASAGCPAGWASFRFWCYRYFGEAVTEPVAQANCANQGGFLVSIRDNAENDFVYGLYKKARDAKQTPHSGYDGYWIGLIRSKPGKKVFAWTDGFFFKVPYFNWMPGEPNNGGLFGREDCVHVWRRSAADDGKRQWNDLPCSKTTAYVCEIDNRG